MSALAYYLHQAGDCGWPCHYCQLEDERALTFTEPDYDDEEDGDEPARTAGPDPRHR